MFFGLFFLFFPKLTLGTMNTIHSNKLKGVVQDELFFQSETQR